MPLISNIGTQVDLQVVSGTDWSTTITLSNANGTPLDLTGCSVSSAVKKTPLSSLIALALTTVIAANPTTGIITLSVAYAVNNLDGGLSLTDPNAQYVWDIRLVDSLGHVSRPIWGNFYVWAAVTPPT